MQTLIKKLIEKSPKACIKFCNQYGIETNGFPYNTFTSFMDRYDPIEILGSVIEFGLLHDISILFSKTIKIKYNNEVKILNYTNNYELLSFTIRYIFHIINKL